TDTDCSPSTFTVCVHVPGRGSVPLAVRLVTVIVTSVPGIMVVSLVMASRTPGIESGQMPDIAQIPRTSWNGLPAAFRPMHKSTALGSVPRKVRTAHSEYL